MSPFSPLRFPVRWLLALGIDEGRYTDEELADRQTPLSGVFSIENAAQGREALQRAVDRVVAIIQADPNKDRIDTIITRWLKRHLQRLGADINLDRLNSLVEDRDMLAENLENWAKKERQEGLEKGREEGREEEAQRILQRLLTKRFGELPAWVVQKLDAADAQQLEAWMDEILVVDSLDALFKH